MMEQRLHPKLARAIELVEHHLAAGAKTKNELYSLWAALGNEPADLRDALERLAEDGRLVDSKLGATKLLRLASSKPEPLPPPEPPRTWMPGVKPRAAAADSTPAAAPAPASPLPSVAPVPAPAAWADSMTTGEVAQLLGVSGSRVKQFGDDGRLSWRDRAGTKRNREYSRPSVEALAELRARGQLSRPGASSPPPCMAPASRAPEVAASAAPAEPSEEENVVEPSPALPPPVAPAPAASLTRFALVIPAPLVDFIEQLRCIGLYGDTVEAVAERLICEALLRHIDKPRLKLRGAA